MQQDSRRDFEETLTANQANPEYKKGLTNPADGSHDKKFEKRGRQHKDRRQSGAEGGQIKKQKTNDSAGPKENDQGAGSGGQRGRGGGRGGRGGGRGGHKHGDRANKGQAQGQNQGQKSFKDKGGVE